MVSSARPQLLKLSVVRVFLHPSTTLALAVMDDGVACERNIP